MDESAVEVVKERKRGRPRKDARNAAVFIALFWRKEILGESSNAAQEWIRHRWQHHGLGADKKDVRDAKKFAKERGLNHSYVFSFGDGWVAVELVNRSEIVEGARAWIWHPDLHEASEGRVRNPTASIFQERLEVTRTPLANAVSALFRR